jgi:hypothetical protein
MPLNKNKCDQCEHFDPVLRGTKPTPWGWCAKRSIYPVQEGPGQVFPVGVMRAEPGSLAEPYMVRRGQVIDNCTTFLIRRVRSSKAELINQLLTNKKGKVVLK